MFRHKPTALERISDAISDIGDRIVDLEERVVERVNPAPSTTERMRRAIQRNLPGHSSGVSRYVPDFLTGWTLPSTDDARSTYRSLRNQVSGLGSSLYGLRDDLPDVQDRLSDVRGRLSRVDLPDARLPRWGSFRRGMKAQSRLDYFRDRPGLTTLAVLGGTIAVAGAAYYVAKKVSDHTEEPDYNVVRQDGDIEIRDYDGMVVAETVKSGYHEKARRVGFETLADYIFANNRSGKKIPMTAPVLQQLSEAEGQTRGWAIRFVMPKRFTKAALPQPASSDVKLKDVPAKRVVVIRFSGNFTASLASKKLMLLYNYIADENLKQKGDPEYAFYNPPWTPGLFKRNEILIEIER
ncbi:hypothetical protein ASG43_05525 [Aureimonas sp. Leaf454]|uniref:SOUL family heme-binding protein n=1 Tax=Aureimonas sp. Leaf454 TaxID=1736381 RepID=UPI0006F4FD09|nr:heme-binding protein [Aureimonas sp. Leaf454]KQT50739.1 hypothetical protein ASG43_05525 [Aureimonas sp. Leaf454]